MRRAAIVAPARTAVGAFGGALRSVTVEDLGAAVIRAVLQRSGLDPARVEDVVMAQSYPSGEAPCIGRWAALQAGLPVEVPGMQLDRRCGGGLQAIVTAAMMVQSGAADVVLARGVESMSNVEYYSTDLRWGARSGSVRMHDRLQRARAAAAQTAGRFDREVVPIPVTQKKGAPIIFARDEGVRGESTAESLARLAPIIEGGTVTAGNAAQQNDAAAACLVVVEDRLDALQLKPMGWLVGWAAAGCEPATMGLGPVPAVRRLFARTGLSFDAMDLVELNEAFAVQVLAVLAAWGWNDADRLNVNGSGVSLGHPIGATGVRILATLLHELERRQGRYGLEAMCIGGGQGVAAIFERAA